MEEEVQHKLRRSKRRGKLCQGMGYSIDLSSNPIKGARMERIAYLALTH
jgi:hypothetical protein